MATYVVRADVESIYGRENVAKWAALGPDESKTVVDARILAKMELASSMIDARLAGTTYELPFTTLSPELVDATARLTGVLLYEPRALDDTDEEGKHKLSGQEKKVDEFINRVRTGRLRLAGSTVVASNIPEAVSFD